MSLSVASLPSGLIHIRGPSGFDKVPQTGWELDLRRQPALQVYESEGFDWRMDNEKYTLPKSTREAKEEMDQAPFYSIGPAPGRGCHPAFSRL
jgi:hypothetical protein